MNKAGAMNLSFCFSAPGFLKLHITFFPLKHSSGVWQKELESVEELYFLEIQKEKMFLLF